MASDSEISCTNDPNFAVIYSFLKVFGKLYGLDVPTIAKFQEFIENTQEVLDPLKEIHVRLLRRALKSVQSNKWERSLIKFCHQHGHHQEAWEMERFSYKKASAQVKLKVLKLLLEYQFTCHPKFKSAVNALSCKDLRLDPIGRDKNGCVYWYQVDDDANLCLYKEDQDEETWQIVARNREELVKVITQLKNGEEVCPLVSSNANEDSSSADLPAQAEVAEIPKPEEDEDAEEEFLSPESESEQEAETQNEKEKTPVRDKQDELKPKELIEESKEESQETKDVESKDNVKESDESLNSVSESINSDKSPKQEENVDDNKNEENESLSKAIEEPVMIVTGEGNGADCESQFVKRAEGRDNMYFYDYNIRNLASFEQEISVSETVSEEIVEPLMFITGEGNGAECDSTYIIGDEIAEEIMYFFGEGSGYENDTGNPEVIEQQHSAEENTDAENGNEEGVNGEHDVPNLTNSAKVVKNIKLKSNTVNKRTLKKPNNDNNDTEVIKSEPKKPCVRNVDPSDCPNSNKLTESTTDSRESSVNDKNNTENDNQRKNNVKKGKVKKRRDSGNKLKLNDGTEVSNSVTESDNCHDSKASSIEKRKSSVSSVDHDENDHAESEKEKSPDNEVKVEDPLPPKKLRLDTPESDVTYSYTNETLNSNNKSVNEINSDSKVKAKTEDLENSVSLRKKIKANKGKFKRKRILKVKTENDAEKDESDNNTSIKETKLNKSLKRTLLDATLSDKNKSESQSESEEDEPITRGKRLKFKPKKIITSSRKKVEAKLQEKQSSDESEEETLYSIAGKKSTKKVLKRKPKGKEKGKDKKKEKVEKGESGAKSEDSDAAPVRQSRRIAQMKIKEEAERRHLEEVALREMKMIHKKKNKDDEEEWQASGSSSEGEKGRGVTRRKDKWRGGDSTGPDQESESDEPLFELHEEPDPVDTTKSDHEFSPESDLESGEPIEPVKRVRTLQEGKEDGVCARCGSGEQPEWILLCDQCDAGYHASCLKPMLFLVPEGDWYCPPCNHNMLIASLEKELTKYDELVVQVEAERVRRKQEEPEKQSEDENIEKEKSEEKSQSEGESSSSGWSSSSSSGAVYRLRARKQLPVSYRSQEYDRLISSAIKEEYVEPTTSAGNQGRGKDISTIIEAAEEEKMKAEREAVEQGKPLEAKKLRKKTRRKPRKLNSLEVPSEDDDETDEDFKETGIESSSEDISSSAERDSTSDSQSSDNLPIRRTGRTDKKDRPKLAESSPEVKKKKKGVFEDSSSESAGAQEWSKEEGKKSKSKSKPPRPKRDKSSKKSRKRSGLTQYDAAGNVVRARVTYGGLSDEGPNDWSPKHRTRQKKINYTEMPNTESEDEMHKSSGKHMPDSSDEFKVDDSDLTSDSDGGARRKSVDEEKQKALNDLICKTAVVPLEKLPEDITKAKTEQLEEHLKAQQDALEASSVPWSEGSVRGARGGGRGGARGAGRGGGRGRGRGRPAATDDALAKLVGVKIKDLKTDGTPLKPNDVERAKKRQEREAKQAEKEARRAERLQKKEEKEKLKEQKAKEREEKKMARLALQESKRMKKEKVEFPAAGAAPAHFHAHEQQRYPQQPRLQVRPELRGVAGPEERLHVLREGTLSVAGSPQPFKPVTEEPSIITRMPHMINQQYRGPMMYPQGNSPYGPRGQNMMYSMHHPGMNPAARHQYPPGYYPPQMRALPPAYPPTSSPGPGPHGSHLPPGHPSQRPLGPAGHPGPRPPPGHQHGPHGPPGHPPGGPHGQPVHSPGGLHGPPGHPPGGPHGPPGASHGPPGGPHGPPGGPHGPPGHSFGGHPGHSPGGPHGPLGPNSHGPPTHPLHGQLRATMGAHGPHGPHGPLRPHSRGSPGLVGGPPHPPSPLAAAPRPAAPTPPAADGEPPIKIKAEVKTEPEYRTPPSSPRPPSPREDPPRNHPKIKHTENKDRRPRFPLGPYAPQYGPYGPYAPPQEPPMPRPPPGAHPLQRMQQLHRLLPAASPPADPPYLSAHIRSSRPPYFAPPMRPPPDRSSPHYPQSPYDPQRSALSKQLAAPPTMPLLSRERLERLSSPPGPAPPGPAPPTPPGPGMSSSPGPGAPSPLGLGPPAPLGSRVPPPLGSEAPSPLGPGAPHPLGSGAPHSLLPGAPPALGSGAPSPLGPGGPHPLRPGAPHPLGPGAPPLGSGAPSPLGPEAPPPLGSGAPSPLGPGAPHPLGSGAPPPQGSGAPSPLGPRAAHLLGPGAPSLRSGAPSPLGPGAPPPLGSGAPSPLGPGAPSPLGPGAPSPLGSGAPSPLRPGAPPLLGSRAPSPLGPRASHGPGISPLTRPGAPPTFGQGASTSPGPRLPPSMGPILPPPTASEIPPSIGPGIPPSGSEIGPALGPRIPTPPAPRILPPETELPLTMRPGLPAPPAAAPAAAEPPAGPAAGQAAGPEEREEGSVFGGLVSYFSSQREDDIDA
ncbi:remodeling and spacing factor 1 [Amyelois transitella]|uniref:remodeling and spacing factor 1 n=1 Tax=Amyelois transitella TaxID=680683 RepID=UPI00299075A6|nr:remodeling and spacing factor 1 [Amyelois transitella]